MSKTPLASKPDDHSENHSAPKRKTCFVMMPISDVEGYPIGHFSEVYEGLIKPAVEAAGYVCDLATSTSAAHFIPLDIVTKAATADLCVCDLSTRNANVLFEYGIRQAFDLDTVLIKDDVTPSLFDVGGFRYVQYKHTMRIQETLNSQKEIQRAIEDTVAGGGDDAQVFSLVKMMKLTKAAALPSEEITRDEARFELLQNKIDNLASLMKPKSFVSLTVPGMPHDKGMPTMDENGPLTFKKIISPEIFVDFYRDHLNVFDRDQRQASRYVSQSQLESSFYYTSLSEQERAKFDREIRDYSPYFPTSR